MVKLSYALFAFFVLALFVMPVSAMQSNTPLPHGRSNATLAFPGLNATRGAHPITANPQNANSVINEIRNRFAEAGRPIALNTSDINATIGQRLDRIQNRDQDARQTEELLVQANGFLKNLNSTQHQKLAMAVFGFINKSLENRVDAASRFETRGMNPAMFADYNASVEDIKDRIMSANSSQERRMLINQANREWADFKKMVVKQAALARVLNATVKAQAALDKLNVIISNLSQNGVNTTKLENISNRVQKRIDAARQQNITLRQAEWNLAYARDGLVHLANQVRRAVRADPVEDMQERKEPKGLDVEDETDITMPRPTITPTPTATVEATATPTPTPVANATASQ